MRSLGLFGRCGAILLRVKSHACLLRRIPLSSVPTRIRRVRYHDSRTQHDRRGITASTGPSRLSRPPDDRVFHDLGPPNGLGEDAQPGGWRGILACVLAFQRTPSCDTSDTPLLQNPDRAGFSTFRDGRAAAPDPPIRSSGPATQRAIPSRLATAPSLLSAAGFSRGRKDQEAPADSDASFSSLAPRESAIVCGRGPLTVVRDGHRIVRCQSFATR